MKIKFAILMMLIFFISGCTNQRQLHDRLIVQGIGIDHEKDSYKVTVDIFDVDSSEEEMAPKIVESEGSSVLEALSNMNNQTGEQLLYSQNFVILIGKETAERGVNEIIDFFVRHHEARPSVSIFSVDGLASEAMKCNVGGKTITSQNIEDIAKADSLNAEIIGSNVLKFVSATQNPTSDPKTLSLKLEKSKEKTILKSGGLAIFSKDKLSGFLDQDETIGALLISSKVKDTVKVVEIPDIGKVTFSVSDSSSKIDVNVHKSMLMCDIQANVNADIYEFDNKGNTGKKLEDYSDILQSNLAKNLEFSIWKAINKVVIEYQSDAFCIGQRFFKNDPQNFKEFSKDWKENMKKARYFVKVSVKLQKTGKEI
ncbi:MAG: Ger(x)C family spore germination protein [Oscillospiraceae bacterium]|jgi:spore germination protein KC|nr:Ger(x)C family spore germination protein [Oscillospiraceae bacterium]